MAGCAVDGGLWRALGGPLHERSWKTPPLRSHHPPTPLSLSLARPSPALQGLQGDGDAVP